MRYALLSFALAIAMAAPVFAAQMNLAGLQETCNALDKVSKAACSFYILGITESANIGAGVAQDKKHFCVPDGVTNSQITTVVQKAIGHDLMLYPEDRIMPAVSFVSGVILREWPCPK